MPNISIERLMSIVVPPMDQGLFRKSNTSWGWASAYLIVCQCLMTSPSGPTTTGERIVPCTCLPYIIFSQRRGIFSSPRFWVSEQDVGQLQFFGKLRVRFDAVLADADDDCIGFFVLGILLAEPASLLGSTRRMARSREP